MSSRKNKDIRGFFRPASTSNSQNQKQPASSPLSMSDPPPADLPSSPRTPQKSAPRVFSRDAEIKGSDDSEDESDDSLGSITDALGYRSGPAAHRRDPNVLSTPQAKRIASGIHRSPLTLQPKRHKFDLKALINHSREIERTEESFRKADALIAQTGRNSDISDISEAENDPKRLEETACKLFVGEDDEDGKGDKIRRAFKRSKDDETSSRKHCYFFGQEEPPPSTSKNAFPRKKATGRWRCLSHSDARRRAFIMGLPHTFLTQGEALPDELFLWILDEICREQNAELRRQYINLSELCNDNTTRLVDDVRLYALLEKIGGPKYAQEPTEFRSTAEARHEYLERNWSPLVAFLQLLDRIAPGLQTTSAISAVQLLLRMSMDPVVTAVVREHYIRAITTLVSNLAKSKSKSKWNTACEAICSYIYKSIDDLELKATVLLSIPSSSPHLVDLRRRLAAESLFAAPGLGSEPIDAHLSFERIRNRLDQDDFKSTNRADFDFERLRVLTTLLDIVIDRADFTSTRDPEEAHKFDAEIDALAARVKAIHDKIRDKASRKNVKLALLGLEKRLKYAVRTRPPPKREIFAFEGPDARADAAAAKVPKQRDFMRQWALKKKAEREDKEVSVVEAAEFAQGGRRRRAARGLPVAVG
ncbi:hypothetical protein F4803DRAFT_500323 [Xylaria telfairii]|nr:hypothetical protein F4803DRAFT_500323 [Xylaria telfairii]